MLELSVPASYSIEQAAAWASSAHTDHFARNVMRETTLVESETIQRHGVDLERYHMAKRLSKKGV